MYEAEYHPKIRKDLKKIDPSIREKIRTEHIPRILADPGAGESLAEDLKGTFFYHFRIAKKEYRIAYRTDEDDFLSFCIWNAQEIPQDVTNRIFNGILVQKNRQEEELELIP